MGRLFETIRTLVGRVDYLVGQHAAERLDERGLLEWQVVDGVEDGQLMIERPTAQPNPAIEIRQTLADGSQVKAVWSLLPGGDIAKLVTVNFFDE